MPFWRALLSWGAWLSWRPRPTLGAVGEQLAVGHLRSIGFTILARNVRTPFGEIDIIAQRADLVAFVEVKTRTSTRYGQAAEAVDHAKAERLRKSVALLHQRKEYRELRCRIDVIEVDCRGDEPRIRHIEDAVSGDGWP